MRRSLGVTLVLIGVVAAALAWLSPRWSWAVLASDSMEPWASPGDLLLHRQVPAEEIRVGDEVVVEGPKAFAVGRAEMHGEAMVESTRGMAVDVRHVEER